LSLTSGRSRHTSKITSDSREEARLVFLGPIGGGGPDALADLASKVAAAAVAPSPSVAARAIFAGALMTSLSSRADGSGHIRGRQL
jgi:hypothetical protein